MAINHVALAMPAPWREMGVLLGRASLPLFASIIVLRLCAAAPGRARRYLLRLVLWGLVAQPVYMMLLAGQPFMRLNALITLAAGVALIYLCEEGFHRLAVLAAVAYVAADSVMDGGAWMAVSIWLAWLVMRPRPDRRWAGLSVIALAAFGMTIVHNHLPTGHAFYAGLVPLIVVLASLRLSIDLPRLPGVWFYAFYPAHLALILVWYGPY